MVRKLYTKQSDFAKAFSELLQERAQQTGSVTGSVSEIIAQVRERKNTALIEYTCTYDRWEASAESIKVTPQEIANALALCSPELMKSLKIAAKRIRSYSEKQLPQDLRYVDEQGIELGWKWSAIDAVGLYVPGGKASYPSSVLMNAIPALTAGVKRLAMVVPAPEGHLNLAVLAAAHVADISEIYKIGGAQAVAALAYGTESIAPVDKIVGPGNAYVAEAKRQVFGQVGIDMIAGPSEICVVADDKNNPRWIAADLLSQAEHDELAQSILITDSAAFADKVFAAVQQIVKDLPRNQIASVSWENEGVIIVADSLNDVAPLINQLAPEHLELAVEQPELLLKDIKHAGAIFLGRHTPEAVGDYIAGPSHVLPTSRTARFASGLSVLDFMKRTSLIGCSAYGLASISMYGEVLASMEGLQAHEMSLNIRRE